MPKLSREHPRGDLFETEATEPAQVAQAESHKPESCSRAPNRRLLPQRKSRKYMRRTCTIQIATIVNSLLTDQMHACPT